MSKIEESVGFYHKMAELQEKLRKSEEERLQLEEKFTIMMRSCREEEEARLQAVRERYEKFLEDDKRRRDRNEKILQTLDKIESRANILSAKTERLKLLRQHYEAYLMRMYPLWKNKVGHSIDKRVMNRILASQKGDTKISPNSTRVLPGNLLNVYKPTETNFTPTDMFTQSPMFYDPYTMPPKEDLGVTLQLHSPSTPVRKFPSLVLNKNPMQQNTYENKPKFAINVKDAEGKIVNGSLKGSENYFNNERTMLFPDITKTNESETITKVPTLTGYIGRTAELLKVQIDSMKKIPGERKEDEQDSIVNDQNDSNKHAFSADIEIEQNTSKDLLNISMSDDGIVQEEGNISLPNAFTETFSATQRASAPSYNQLPRHANMKLELRKDKNGHCVQETKYDGENDKDVEHMKEVDTWPKMEVIENDSKPQINHTDEDMSISPQYQKNVLQSGPPVQRAVHFADENQAGGGDIAHCEQLRRGGATTYAGEVGQGDTGEVYSNDHRQTKGKHNKPTEDHNRHKISRNAVSNIVQQQPILLEESKPQLELEEKTAEQEQHLEESIPHGENGLPENEFSNTVPQEIEVFDNGTEYATYPQQGAVSFVEGESEDVPENFSEQKLSVTAAPDPSDSSGTAGPDPQPHGVLPKQTVDQYRNLLGVVPEPASDLSGYSDADDVEDQLAALVAQTPNAPVELSHTTEPPVSQVAESAQVPVESHSPSQDHLETPSSQNDPKKMKIEPETPVSGTRIHAQEPTATYVGKEDKLGKDSKVSDISSESTDQPILNTQHSSVTKQGDGKLNKSAPESVSTVDSVKPQLRTASKKLPGLTKVLESDTESLHLDTTGTSNIDSDEFDFSSEHQ